MRVAAWPLRRLHVSCPLGRSVVLAATLVGCGAASMPVAFAQPVMSSEPPPGQLGAGQVVYVSCGPGKARKITGGSDRSMSSSGQSVKLSGGSARQRGPCLRVNN